MKKIYDRPNILDSEIQKYFMFCTESVLRREEDGKVISEIIPSEAGLLLHLGIPRKELAEYLKKPNYDFVLERAALWIENYWIQRGATSNVTRFPIFMLKAKHGYVESVKHEIEDNRPRKAAEFSPEEAHDLKQVAIGFARYKRGLATYPEGSAGMIEHSDSVDVVVNKDKRASVKKAAKIVRRKTKPKRTVITPPKMKRGDEALMSVTH